MGTGIQKYQAFTAEDADVVDQEVAANSGSVFLDIEQGETQVRALPPRPGAEHKAFRVVYTHYIEPLPGFDQKLVFQCPLKHLQQPCPACAEAQRLTGSRNPLDQKRGKDLMPRTGVLFNALSRDNPAMGPRVVRGGPMIWRKIKKLCQSRTRGGDPTDPTHNGYDLIIERDGTGMQTKYDVFPDRNSSALAGTEAEIDEIIELCHDLDALVDCEVPVELIEALGAVGRAGRTPPRRSAVSDARQASAPRGAALATADDTGGWVTAEVADPAGDPDDPANW